tara:strand:- start:1112 stop:2041 length:930 start_codon:yes stop_codon:yes gene_type:complete
MVKKDFYSQGSRNQFKRRGEDLTITHVPTGEGVKFPAFLDLFSDSFSSQWNAEDVYGRMDPIATFMNTRRAISVAWHVPADSFEHAEINVAKVNKLMSFLYPLYDASGNGGATVINQGPLVRVSFGNLIKSSSGTGLLGYVNGFTFDPALEFGMFSRRKVLRDGTRDPQVNEYYPKTFRLNFELVVLHEHELGYKKQGSKYVYNGSARGVNKQTFPYRSGQADPDRVAKRGAPKPSVEKPKVKNRQPQGTQATDEKLPELVAPQPALVPLQPKLVPLFQQARRDPNSVSAATNGAGFAINGPFRVRSER